jgi:hypothetical protein
MSQLAVGAGWSTVVEIINTTAAAANASLTFLLSDGTPLALPLSPAGGATTNSSQWQGTLAPYAREVITIPGSASAPVQIGSAHLTSTTGVSGFIRYSYAPWGQEAIVPAETRTASSYVVAFDNTSGASNGIAVANSSPTGVNIPVTIFDETGTQIATGTLTLPAQGQTTYVLTDRVAGSANARGSVQFSPPAGISISVLGIRFPNSDAFTTIPVITP